MGFENKIPKGWVETTLGYLMADKGYIRGPFGSALKRDEMLDDGVPVYEQANAIYNHRKFRYFIGNDKHATLSRFTVKPNDILISCSGTFGKTTIIKEDDPKGIISQALLILRSNPCKINTFYLNYYLNSREGKIKLAGMSHGSVQVNIAKRADVESIEFLLPPLPEQKAIAKVLTAFDDKIELLQAQNKTLETMAQTIFKEWFGKYQIEDDLPEGWRVGELNDIIDKIIDNRGKTPPLTLNTEHVYPLIEVNSINGLFRTVNQNLAKKFVDELTYENWFRKGHPINGDILFSTVGSIGQLSQVFNEKICIAQNVVALRSEQSGDFLYALMKFYQKQIIKLDISSVQPSIKIPHLLSFPIVIPDSQSIKKFHDSSRALSEKIAVNSKQIQSLTKTRDTLLPKLMCGQVRVNNINEESNIVSGDLIENA